MDGATLIELFNTFLDGEELSDVVVLQLLNMEKANIESERPWMKLRTFKDDYSFASSDDTKALPDNFLMTYGDKPLKLIAGSDIKGFSEIPMEEKDKYNDSFGYFFINHYSETLAIMGGLSKAYSGTLYYIAETDDIEDGTSWIFPSYSHPLLVVKAIITYRGQIDFDEINARMVKYGFAKVDEMYNNLIMWDAQLQARSRAGKPKGDIFCRANN